MKITKYEIDMLEVGAADAFLLHFWADETKYEYVILIDAGNYEDGKRSLSLFVNITISNILI